MHRAYHASTRSLIVLQITLFCLIFCLHSANVQAQSFRVMFFNDSFPPYYFPENDPRTGINRDLLTAIGAITHDTFVYEYLPFLRAQLMFDNGELDLETCVNPAWRKNAKVPGVYTIAHSKSSNVILFAPDKEIPIRSPEDLKGRSVGVVKGYTYPRYEQLFSEGVIEKVVASDEKHLLDMLSRGRIDQAFMNKTLALYWIREEPEYHEIKVGNSVRDDDIMIRLHPSKGDALDRFNAAIRQLKESGEIKRIFAKYR